MDSPDWIMYLPYPRPTTVPIDKAIELATFHFNRSMENCCANGGCDGDYSGQMRGVDDDEKEVKRLKRLKRAKVKQICTHCGGEPREEI
jgi:hypothetical protein